MDISAIMESVLSKIDDDNKSFVESQFKQIERNIAVMQEDVRSANSEAKERRLKLRDAESKLGDYESEIEKLKNDTTVTELQKQIEQLKGFQSTVFENNRNTFQSKIEAYSKSDKFPKVAKMLGIEVGENNSIDMEKIKSMENTAITNGLTKLSELEQIGVFETHDPNPKPGPKHTPKAETPPPAGDVDIVKLAQTDSKAAAAYFKSQGLGHRSFNHLAE